MARAAAAVVGEAIAILEGTSKDSTVAGWRPRPRVCINVLAHSSWDQLNQLAAGPARPGGSWESATSFLATEMCAAAATPAGLLDLQREGLIPLELNVLAGRTSPPDTPVELVAAVRAELDRLRHTRHHPRKDA
jgi:hypothetical protein